GTVFAIWLAARSKLSVILGSAVTLPLIRALGGGSLTDALVYGLVEAGFLLWISGGAALLYVCARLVLRPGRGGPEQASKPWKPVRTGWAVAILAPLLLLTAAAGNHDVRLTLDGFAAPWLAYAALDAATDVDRDGYSLVSIHRDRQPFDSNRHPLALDIPGNGIDEDGLAGDYRHSAGGEFLPAPRFGGERRHVILIALESTRAEMLGKRWNGRLVAPNLTAMAAGGLHSGEAYSHAGYTRPSLKSLLTGRIEPVRPGSSLFSDFRRAGYRTAVLSTEAEDFGGIAEVAGMRENSDVFIDAKVLRKESLNPLTRDITLLLDPRVLIREFDRHFGRPSDWARPTFLYLNVQTSHYPYDFPGTPRFLPGPPVPRDKIRFAHRDWTRRTYWNSVAYGDWVVGRILARLKGLNVLGQGVVLVVADHGEELFENDYIGHGQRINDLQTRIPFVLSRRGIAIPRPVGLADVRGLLLRAAGAEMPAPEAGRPVFQHTIDLDRPVEIAMVEAGRRRTVMHLPSREVRYEEADVPKLRGNYRDLAPGSALRAKADRLIRLWERERWIRHLEGRSARPR
ncbi:sulfatase-like hydrolase/transferase, partial [Allosphingosinicella sp.]|uniref:sulfatase-like hydrolase/transferase n=1 Tax=Allosphingosinicella sp. TaxID=2823234 RepID=UPI002F077D8F